MTRQDIPRRWTSGSAASGGGSTMAAADATQNAETSAQYVVNILIGGNRRKVEVEVVGDKEGWMRATTEQEGEAIYTP